MVKLNDIEKKIQNYQKNFDYNVRYENNGEKRIYTIYPGQALEFFRQTVSTTPLSPGMFRPSVESNATVEYVVKEKNGIITSQSFTAMSPVSSADFSRENQNIFFDNNQREIEFGRTSSQNISVFKPQVENYQTCQCKPVQKSCP